MVQIRRTAVKQSLAKKCSGKCFRCLRMVALSSVIPAVFVLRFFTLDRGSYHTSSTSHSRLQIPTADDASGPQLYAEYIDLLQGLDYGVPNNLLDSNTVELYHCNVTSSSINWTDFLSTADSLLTMSVEGLRPSILSAVSDRPTLVNDLIRDMRHEFLLELLEQYLSTRGYCDYARYRPTVTGHEAQGYQLQQSQGHIDASMRLVFVISVFTDVDHLSVLLEAIHQPQHFIVLHLERDCPTAYQTRVEELLTTQPLYTNVVVVQFGTIVYKTDSLSLVNLRILRWLTVDLNLPFEYALLLDGSVFPLYSATELVAYLQSNSHRSVWLGELTHQGQRVSAPCGATQLSSQPQQPQPVDHLLRHKRLIFTRHNLKLHKRLPSDTWGGGSNDGIPNAIRNNLIYKSTSGNQGVYSRLVVEQLLQSDRVMELFALSKYGCCCCLEERNWIAALGMIGFACQALEQTSMFQVWGGERECQGSMKNAVLSTNATLCFRSEDPFTGINVTTSAGYFNGNSTWDLLVDAKRRGVLFARKFRSDSANSVELRSKIQRQLWTIPAR